MCPKVACGVLSASALHGRICMIVVFAVRYQDAKKRESKRLPHQNAAIFRGKRPDRQTFRESDVPLDESALKIILRDSFSKPRTTSTS